MLPVLRQRNVALLTVGHLISVVGSWLLLIALPFYVYQQTGSAVLSGGMFVLEMVPVLLFGSIVGVFIDRWDRRRTMIAADLLRALLLLPLLLASRDEWLWVIYPVAFLESTVTQFFLTARSALLPRLVDDQQLEGANAAISVGEEFALLIGSLLGGATLGFVGITGLTLIDIATYLGSTIAISLVVVPAAATSPEAATVDVDPKATALPPASTVRAAWLGVWRDWVDGLRLVRRSRAVIALFAVTAIAMIGEGVLAILAVAYVEEILGFGVREFSWIAAGRCAGALISGLIVVSYAATRFAPGKVIAVAGVVDGVALLAMLNSQTLPALMLFFGIAGLALVPFYATQQTFLQRLVADDYRGRVFGAWETTQALALLAAAALAGLLAETIGIMPITYVGAFAFIVAGVVAFVTLVRRGDDRADGLPSETASEERSDLPVDALAPSRF